MIVQPIINSWPRKISIVYVIFLFATVQILRSTAKTINNESICQTPLCKDIAETLISTMDQTADPCHSFFQYACGNIGKNNRKNNRISQNFFKLLRDRTNHQIKEILESYSFPNENSALSKSKQLYKACMDTGAIEKNGLASLLRLIEEIGGWPMTMKPGEWELRGKSWQEVDLIIRKNLGHTPLFIMTVMADLKNSNSNIQWLALPTLWSESQILSDLFVSRDVVDDAMKLPANREYRQAIVNSAKLIAKHQNYHVPNTQLDADATNVVMFEMELENIISVAKTSITTNINKHYQKISINELQKKCDAVSPKTPNGKIHWLNYIRELYSDVSNIHIDGTEEIAVATQDYFITLIGVLDRTPSRVIVNTMNWWLVKELAISLNTELRNIIIENTIQESAPRWKFCMSQKGMSHAIAQAYVKKYISHESKHYVSNMLKEIVLSMRENIQQSKWLDYNSKNEALKKLSQMKEFVGYPDWYEDDINIANYYNDLNVGPYFCENTLSVSKFNFLRKLKLLRKPVDNNEWIAKPTDINAFYYYPRNSLTIPAGLLQFPFFDAKQPDVLNYGALGPIIGHEISHGFDHIGSQYDENGRIRNWWSNGTKFVYDQQARCFIDKFSKYGITYNKISYRLNAVQTLSENIADTTGLNTLFEAFTSHSRKNPAQVNVKLPGLEYLDHNKLLFLIWAQTICERPKSVDLIRQMQNDNHSPAPFRIVGTLANINSFSDTYQCSKGTVMNPARKCFIW